MLAEEKAADAEKAERRRYARQQAREKYVVERARYVASLPTHEAQQIFYDGERRATAEGRWHAPWKSALEQRLLDKLMRDEEDDEKMFQQWLAPDAAPGAAPAPDAAPETAPAPEAVPTVATAAELEPAAGYLPLRSSPRAQDQPQVRFVQDSPRHVS